jgi:hypothetical protein
MEPGRSFSPPATSVTVQAIHDADSIALLVRWYDRSAEKAGKNGPTLPVAPEEEEIPALAPAGQAPAGADPFADQVATTPAPGAAADPFADDTAAAAAPAAEFSDAVAVQIPSQAPTGSHKPYFIFGDATNTVDLLFFDLAQGAPVQFTGKGSADVTPKEAKDLTGVAAYDQGEWSVIFKRPLRPEGAAAFTDGEFMPIAFSVWDGFSRERGSRRGLTLWYSLYLEPQNVPSVVGPMIRTALIILGLELAVIGYVRWRERTRGREGLGGRSQPAPSV